MEGESFKLRRGLRVLRLTFLTTLLTNFVAACDCEIGEHPLYISLQHQIKLDHRRKMIATKPYVYGNQTICMRPMLIFGLQDYGIVKF